jgi:hypothetical protein
MDQIAAGLLVLVLLVGFWFGLARPALNRNAAPAEVRQAVVAVTVLGVGATIVRLSVVLLNLDNLIADVLQSVAVFPVWVLIAVAGYPRYTVLRRALSWFDARRR